jgi:BASS family bile acid:Na+ symporter
MFWMKAESIIRVLTICSLSGLLLGVGLRLTVAEVLASVRRCRLALIVILNFVIVPALVVAATRLFGLGPDISLGMILLSAAPFAPVVPVFTRMARADLALAAGLSTMFPLLCVFFTPFVVGLALRGMPAADSVRFNTLEILLTLLATIVLPLGAGMTLKTFAPKIGRWGLRPVEIISEFTGALSLAFVTFTEWRTILATGWVALLVMALLCEISILLGYAAGGPDRNARRVVGLGTGNRNIALAILVAIESFGDTPVLAAVVANGLLLILMGLLHVAFWRFGPCQVHRASE